MKCINPRKLPNPARTGFDDYYIVASCGKCYACLANRRRSWLFRLKNEQMESSFCVFVTFTYDDDTCDGYLHKSDLQKFHKSLRHYHRFTYYAIGEYGTTTFRPHYHAVYFFKDDKCELFHYQELFEKIWHRGFVSVKKCSYRRLNYVLHYHVRPKLVNGKSTFQIFSKGMGIGFIDDPSLIDFLLSNNTALVRSFDGGTFVIPRYYRKKLSEYYDVDLKCEIPDAPFPLDAMVTKVFGKPLYQIPEEDIVEYLKSLQVKSDNKIKKYNNQDKFI